MSFETLTRVQRTTVDRACGIVWPIERPFIRWFFSRQLSTSEKDFEEGLKYDGFEALVYWRASAFWALGATLLGGCVALPLVIIGIFETPSLSSLEGLGYLTFFLSIVQLFISAYRRSKYTSERKSYRALD